MPSLGDNPTDNPTAELVTEIEKIVAERAKLSEQFSAHEGMISSSEGLAIGLSRPMQNTADQLTELKQNMRDAVSKLEQVQPDHELVKMHKEEARKTA